MAGSLEYGPIICVEGPHKGRVGYFDDIGNDCSLCSNNYCLHNYNTNDCDNCLQNETKASECIELAIIYFGEMILCTKNHMIPIEYCSNTIHMRDLAKRVEELQKSMYGEKNNSEKNDLLLELGYAKTLFYAKYVLSNISSDKGKKLLISHSSKDKTFANCLYADLIEQGHNPWLDNRDIKPGQFILKEIQKALKHADYTLMLLSPNTIMSDWVVAEWESAYWDEITTPKVKVTPLLIKSCEIPPFQKTRKYLDIRNKHQDSLDYLLKSI